MEGTQGELAVKQRTYPGVHIAVHITLSAIEKIGGNPIPGLKPDLISCFSSLHAE